MITSRSTDAPLFPGALRHREPGSHLGVGEMRSCHIPARNQVCVSGWAFSLESGRDCKVVVLHE